MGKLKKFLGLISEGYALKDKFALSFYSAETFFRKMLLLKENPKLIYDVTLKNRGGLFYCGRHINSVWVASSFHEKEIKDYFCLKSGIFVDIGANIGKYTVIAGRKLGNRGKVVSIEPEPSNFKILERNIRLNKLNNVVSEQAACSSKEGNINLYLRRTGTGGHSLVRKSGEKIIVKSLKLDSILIKHKIKRISLIKIDAEGAEYEVLRGAKKTLKWKPKIIFESWNEEYLGRIRRFLAPFGYKIRKISADNYFAY